jgi:phosphohistidine phosphatase
MLLYLVQHGEAKREDEDPARGLTEKGAKDVKKVAQFLQNKILSLSYVFHSNKTRAIETARILADHLKPSQGVSEAGNLAPMDDPAIWANRIAGMNGDIMLVGHLPFMARLAGHLLCFERENPLIDFKMGGIVCLLRSDDGRWSLEWMIVPEILANLF